MNLKKFIINFLLISCILLLNGCIDEETTNGKYDIYVGANINNGYSTIQKAIENSSNGDSIFIYDGLYNENIIINKSISIIGESNDKTIINYIGNQYQEISFITLLADNCTIDNIKINNSNGTDNVLGIVIKSSNNIIINTSITNTEKGIYIDSDYNVNSRNNSIVMNNFSNNNYGLHVTYSNNNNISKNNIFNNKEYGIYLQSSEYNIISYSKYAGNDCGIRLKTSKYNKITYNNISFNKKGLYICCGSYNNNIHHNNFINNDLSADDGYTTQYYTSSSPFEGNYWSDFKPSINASDKYTGKNYDILGSDGIWDNSSYLIYRGDNEDIYPFVNPILLNLNLK
ncbi:NosD domain-containing protein [Thermoplasmatota archaeon]